MVVVSAAFLERHQVLIVDRLGAFPTDEAALKLLYLALKNARMRWRKPVDWTQAMSQFAILFGERFALSAR